MGNTNFLKIIYFDETFVADFMQIIAGGSLKKTTEFISEVNSGLNGAASIETKIESNNSPISKFFSFLSGVSISMGADANANISKNTDKIVKNILENTLLADFVTLLDGDQRRTKNPLCKGITKFSEIEVKPIVNSFTYFMLIAPFLSIVDGKFPLKTDEGDAANFDVTKIEEAIKKGRGYYEFETIHDNKEIILRFNQNAFRNSYTMSDLPKMLLTYYGIKVGKINKSDLQVQEEFEFGTAKVSKRIDYTFDSKNANDDKKIDVYDIVLAAIEEK